MKNRKSISTQIHTILLGLLVFNFSICLAEIDIAQRMHPGNQLTEYASYLANGLQGSEEDHIPSVEIDLFVHNNSERSIISPYYSLSVERYDQPFLLIYHPQEKVTPPPEV